jgi:hypothetical protein
MTVVASQNSIKRCGPLGALDSSLAVGILLEHSLGAFRDDGVPAAIANRLEPA